jgi:ubiquinone/menaquinone biosynthesis C-methylase UbiE
MTKNITKWRDIWQRFAGKGIYPYQLAFLLDSPLRKLIISPQKLAARLHLAPTARVLEIGAGPGYFSVEVANRIPDGTLMLFDIQREMLEMSRKKLKNAGIKNFHVVQGSAVSLPFRSSVLDVVFMVTVLGEVSKPDECLRLIHHSLRPNGILSVTEMQGDPDALTPDKMIRLAEDNGFQFLEQFSFFGGYTLNLRKGIFQTRF